MQLTQLTNKQTQQSSWFFGSHYKTTSFVGNGRIPVLRVSDIGEFPNLKEQVGHIRKHLRGDMKPPKRFHQSGNSSLKSERNNDVTDNSLTSKMAKFVSLDGHFTKFSWVLNKNIATLTSYTIWIFLSILLMTNQPNLCCFLDRKMFPIFLFLIICHCTEASCCSPVAALPLLMPMSVTSSCGIGWNKPGCQGCKISQL